VSDDKIDAKAARYLSEGRVKAQHVSSDAALFHVRGSGDGDPYYVRFSAAGWMCDCPARVASCAHVRAARLVCDLSAGTVTTTNKPVIGFAPQPAIDIEELLGGL
jgi:uncharacterized Zn finger protein